MVAAVPPAVSQAPADMGLGLSLGDRTPSFPDGFPTSSSTASLRKSSRVRAPSSSGRSSALDGPISGGAVNGDMASAVMTPKPADVAGRLGKVYGHTRTGSGGRGSGGSSSHLASVPEASAAAMRRTSRPSGGGRSTPGPRSYTPGPYSLPASSSLNGPIASSSQGSSSHSAGTAAASVVRRSHFRNGSYDIDMDSGLDTALSIVNSPILIQSPNQQTPQQHQQQFQPAAPTLVASELRIPNSASSRELAMHAKDFVKAISTLSSVEDGSEAAISAKADQEELLRKARALLEIEVRAAQYPPPGEDAASWNDSLARSRSLGVSNGGRRKPNDEWWRGSRAGRRPSATPSEVRPESPLDAHLFGGLSTSASTPEGALGRIALPHVPETSAGSRSSGESITGPLGHSRKVSGDEDEQQEVIVEDKVKAADQATPTPADADASRPGEEQHRLALKAGLAWALQQQEAMIKQMEKTAAETKALRERAEEAERAAQEAGRAAEEAERAAKKAAERSPIAFPKPIDVSLPLSPVPASPATSSPAPGSPASPSMTQRPQPVRLRSKSLFKALRNSKVPEPQSSFARREISTNSAPFELSGPSNRLSALSTASGSQPSADGHAEISAALNKFAAKNSQSAVATKISKTFSAFLSGAWNESSTLTSESQASLPSVEDSDPSTLRASLASARQALAKAEKDKERLQADVEEVSTQLFSEANELVKQERIKTLALVKEVEQLRATITKRDSKARGKGEGGAAILQGAADEVEQSMMEAVKEAMFSCAKAEEETAAMREEVRSMERKVEILEEALFHAVTAVARERSGKQSASADFSGEGLSAVAMGIYDEGKGVTPSNSKKDELSQATATAADDTVRQIGAEEQTDERDEGEAVFVGESSSHGDVTSPRSVIDSAEMSRQSNGSSLSLPRREQSDSAMSFYSVDEAGALSQKGDVEDDVVEEDVEESASDYDEEGEDDDDKPAGLQAKVDDEIESDWAPTPGPRLSDPAPAVPPPVPQIVAAIPRTLQRASSSSSGGSSPVIRGSPTRRGEVRTSWASSSPSLSGRARPSSIPDQLPVPRSPLPDIPSPRPGMSGSSPEPASPAPPAFVTSPVLSAAKEQGRRPIPEKPKLPQRRGIGMAPTASASSLVSVEESQRSESELSQYVEMDEEVVVGVSPPAKHVQPPPTSPAKSRNGRGARPYEGLPVISTAGTLDFNAFESNHAAFSQSHATFSPGPSSSFSHGSDAGEMRLNRTSTRDSERSHEFLDAANGEGVPRAPSRQASIRSVASEAPSLARQAGMYGSRKKILSGTKVIGGHGLEQLSPDMGAVLRPPPAAHDAIHEDEDDELQQEGGAGGNASLKSNKSRKGRKRTVRHPPTFLASSSASVSSQGHSSLASEAAVASRSSLASRSASIKSQMAAHSSLISSPPMQASSPSFSTSSIASPRHSMGGSSIKRSSSATTHLSESVYEEARSGAYIRRFAPTVQDHRGVAVSGGGSPGGSLPAGRRRTYSQKPASGAHPPLPSQPPVF